jgi:hypothetical protein
LIKKLNFIVKKVEKYIGENVVGEIWFEIDGTCFPEKNWSDFPSLICDQLS